MRGVLGLGLSAALICAMPAWAADGLFEAYQSICVATRADPAQSLSAADAAGWSPVPDQLVDQFNSGEIRNASARMKSERQGIYILIVGAMSMPPAAGALTASMCGVGVMPPGDVDRVAKQVASWTAVPANRELSTDGQTGYVFTDEGGVHVAIDRPDDARFKQVLRSGGMKFVSIKSDQNMSMIALAVPAKRD